MALLEVIGIAATVVAALLAAGAIWQAGRMRRDAIALAAKERRNDYELTTLRELVDLMAERTTFQAILRSVVPRVAVLPADEFPVTRDVFGMNGSDASKAFRERVVRAPGRDLLSARLDGYLVLGICRDEVKDAIRRRIATA